METVICKGDSTFRLAFNRTILEWKPVEQERSVLADASFNRTILEWKHKGVLVVGINLVRLLIEPFWNGNLCSCPSISKSKMSFNRTILEWKQESSRPRKLGCDF